MSFLLLAAGDVHGDGVNPLFGIFHTDDQPRVVLPREIDLQHLLTALPTNEGTVFAPDVGARDDYSWQTRARNTKAQIHPPLLPQHLGTKNGAQRNLEVTVQSRQLLTATKRDVEVGLLECEVWHGV